MAFSSVFAPSSSRALTTSSWSSSHVQIRRVKPYLLHSNAIRAVQSPTEGEPSSTAAAAAPKTNPEPSTTTGTPLKLPKKPVYSMKKGQIVRVDKEKYLNSINYLSVGHPPYFKGLDYIYEDRGEVLDLRNFETGEYALISWVGIPTAPAWLPTDMLIKSDKLDYTRI